jgi:membrane-associated phospholipid phosphatase
VYKDVAGAARRFHPPIYHLCGRTAPERQDVIKKAAMTHTALKPSLSHEVARLISIVVHPILLPLLTLGALTYLATGGSLYQLQAGALQTALGIAGIAVLVTALPIALLVIIQVLRGRWTDPDVSVRRQRYLLYPFGVTCMLAAAGVFILTGAPPVAVRATFGIAFANVLNGFINLRYKVSAHATTAALCAMLLWLATPPRDSAIVAVPVSVAAALVGWSRVALGRHTLGQVILGWGVGIFAGFMAIAAPMLIAQAVR